MIKEKHHWKALMNPNYLGSWDFQPNEVKRLTVNEVKMEKVIGSDGKKEDCSTCHWKEATMPLILNVTNSKAIAKIAKSEFVEDWVGTSVYLHTERVKAFGDVVDAVRVVNLPVLTPTHEKWKAVSESLKTKKATMEQVKSRFIVMPDIEAKLWK